MSTVRSIARGAPRWPAACRGGAVALGTLIATALCGCARHENGARPKPSVTAVAGGAASRPAAIGRWRLAPPGELEHVVLWVSHILIRYNGISSQSVPFGVPGWRAEGPPPARSREEALQLARTVLARAHRDLDAFGELAREYSDDSPTRDWGGSLGGVAAAELGPWPAILDELSRLKAGEISGVIETDLGFEILRRRRVPDPVSVAGRRIVIGYDGTPRARLGAEDPERSRDEALREAQDLLARAKAGEPFPRLVEKYSEDPDREQDGDIGLWSNREPTPYGRQIEVLVGLGEGGVSDPIDTAEGIEIVQRTDAHPRASYAASSIKIWFDDGLPEGNEHSRAHAMARARAIARVIKADPSRFASFQREYCCVQPERWTAGRAPPGLTAVLDHLAVGQIAADPIVVFPQVTIAQRLDTSSWSSIWTNCRRGSARMVESATRGLLGGRRTGAWSAPWSTRRPTGPPWPTRETGPATPQPPSSSHWCATIPATGGASSTGTSASVASSSWASVDPRRAAGA